MDIRELIPQEETEHRQIYGMWYATFAYNITSLEEFAHVIIPDININSVWGPCYWSPRCYNEDVNVAEEIPDSGGDVELIPHMVTRALTLLPLKDDIALVTFDNRRIVWVVTWWPR